MCWSWSHERSEFGGFWSQVTLEVSLYFLKSTVTTNIASFHSLALGTDELCWQYWAHSQCSGPISLGFMMDDILLDPLETENDVNEDEVNAQNLHLSTL